MFFLLICLWVVQLGFSIRFNYNLPKYQIQCFHESVEKDSRYQVATRGQTSEYYLHVVEEEAVHEDSRKTGAEFKTYSAFAASNTIVTFCIGNLGNDSIYFDVQFYHGVFLEDAFQTNVQGRELEDLADRWSSMLKMVESNYEIYKRHLFGRRASSRRISVGMSVMVIVIIIGTAIIKIVEFRKIVGALREKKAV